VISRKLKLDINPFLLPKHYKYGGHFSLLVGYNIYLEEIKKKIEEEKTRSITYSTDLEVGW